MKSAFLLPVLLMLPALQASEPAMRKALAQWNRQMTEYRAALEVATTPEQKNSILPPNGSEVASQLWKAISAKTGTRTIRRPDNSKQQVSTYEFEQPWAAPAVAWFVCHPEELAGVLADRPRQRAFFAEALLDALERIHYNHPAVAPVCAALLNDATTRSYTILEKIFSQNPDPTAKASAALALCIILDDPLISNTIGNPAEIRKRRIFYLKQAANYAPENTAFGKVTFEEAIMEITYILRHLSEGSVPPQIHLKDAAGKDATLPTPGQVQLLYFWSPAEEGAFEAVHHMERVKEKYPMLSIHPITAHQEDPEKWAENLELYGITTCYTDDEKGSAAKAYRITTAPTAVLLDGFCRIIYIGAPGLELQTAISRLSEPKKQDTPKRGTGRVFIEDPTGKDAAPALQPAAKPTAPAKGNSDTPPPLREMPEF